MKVWQSGPDMIGFRDRQCVKMITRGAIEKTFRPSYRVGWRNGPGSRIRSALIDNFLHRGGCEDGVALIRAEGEAGGDDGVLPGSAGNLKRRAQVADREGRAQAVGAGDRSPATVVWERSSVDPAVANLAFCPVPEKDWTPAVSALLIRRVTLSPTR